MTAGRLSRAPAPVRPPGAGGPCRRLHVGTDAGRVWIVVGRWSVLVRPRHVVVGLVLLALSLVVALAALRLGRFTVSTQEVIDALQGQGRRIVRVVVVMWKLPRILLGLVAGLALGMAGAVFQTITRNPLGSPDLIGFSTGAQTGILVSVLLLPGGMLSTSLASFIGGAAVGTVTYLVSLRGGFTGLRFILVGIAISSMLVSVNRWLLVRVDDDQGLGALKAVTGTLGAAGWPVVAPTCLAIGVAVVLTLLTARHLQVLSLGEQVATILGSPTRRVSAVLILLGTVLVAVVTMAAGPIGFVALVAPHLARFLTGSPQPPLLVSGLTGSLLLAGADLLSQLVLESMPVSVVTNAVGGLYLMVALTVAARGRRPPVTEPPTSDLSDLSAESPGDSPAACGRAASPARLAARGATIAYERHVVSRDLDVDIPAGVFTAIVGPNACGKSTLLRALARLHRPARGAVLLDGADIARLGTKEVARRVGLLPQSAVVPGGMLVRDLVARGRFPHQGLFRQWSPQDRDAVEEAMEMVGVTELAARPVDELSGGQRQRVWIALALAQGTETILLDEPTTFLDLAHQVDILQLCRRLNTDGRTVVAVLHDLNQAARCAEHMIVMHAGRVRVTGSPRRILTADLIEEVFGLAAVIAPDPVAGTPMVVPRNLGAVAQAGTGPGPVPAAPAPQSSAEPDSADAGPTARSQQDGQERNTDR